MPDTADATIDRDPMSLERSCSLTAVALSNGRREGVRLLTGEHRGFGLNGTLLSVHVPYPKLERSWTRRTLTCGVALQCAPSKERIVAYRLSELSAREVAAVTLIEAGVAAGWVAAHWPGLIPEIQRLAPGLQILNPELDSSSMLEQAIILARSGRPLHLSPLLGRLPAAATVPARIADRVRRRFGRLPWTSNQKRQPRPYSVPVGGDGGVRNPNLPPPSRPEDDDPDISPNNRPGIPYPEWDIWRKGFLRDHVAVLERPIPAHRNDHVMVSTDLRRWFQQYTHRAMTSRLEDGSDLDVDQYVHHYIDLHTGEAGEPRLFRELLPSNRDVTTALLLDGSSSLSVDGGRMFRLELSCADALSRAMTRARERHGIFVFTGNTRHRVEVQRLKDFDDPRFIPPSTSGLVTGGYTRLGAPIRHLTSRLLGQPSERRLLIILGDGLMSDDGYEGKYAWADVAHAVEEANEAGVSVYYLGVGPARVDPLPEVFGARRSQRIRQVTDLPGALAHVHRELVSA